MPDAVDGPADGDEISVRKGSFAWTNSSVGKDAELGEIGAEVMVVAFGNALQRIDRDGRGEFAFGSAVGEVVVPGFDGSGRSGGAPGVENLLEPGFDLSGVGAEGFCGSIDA